MSLLNSLANLFQQRDPRRAQPAAPRPQPRVWEDNSGVQVQQVRPQGMPMQTRGRYEDSQMVASPQGLTPMNADVANYQSAMTQSGFGPQIQPQATQQAGIQAPRTYWQNTDGARRNMVNPQVEDNGFYYN
jgi:hypothetical protein